MSAEPDDSSSSESDERSIQTSDVESHSDIHKGAAHCERGCFKKKNDRGGIDLCICPYHGDCYKSVYPPGKEPREKKEEEQLKAPSPKPETLKEEESVQTQDVSDYDLDKGAAHCKDCTKRKRPAGGSDYTICKKHGSIDMTTFPPVEIIQKKPKPSVGCYEETTRKHHLQEPFFVRLAALEKEICAAHSRKHGESHHTAYLLYSDGTLGQTKGGELLFKRNNKPLMPAVSKRHLFSFPEKTAGKVWTIAVLPEAEARLFRGRIKQLYGIPEGFDGSLQDAANEDSLEELWMSKKKPINP